VADGDPLSPPAQPDRLSAAAADGRGATELERRIGYAFTRPTLLRDSLTHSSAGGRARDRQSEVDNERLEFLGDRVLGLVIAELLFTEFAGEGEGDLTRRHAALVRRETLAKIAAGLDLGACLTMARGEDEAGGRSNPATLADTMEALIGAVFLDGGLEPARGLIERHWRPTIGAMIEPPMDAKTALQEWAQARALGLPRYETVTAEGPDHAPTFEMQVQLADLPPEQASGASKRVAERAAAARLLARLTQAPARGDQAGDQASDGTGDD
jgi:ribonuclease-3